jgi:hypothetical protein
VGKMASFSEGVLAETYFLRIYWQFPWE